MAGVANPSISGGISIDIGSALGSVAEWLRQITVRVIASSEAHGSGVIWRSEGLVVTNAHVVRSQAQEIELSDGRRLQGWLLGRDRKRDLAALAVNSGGLPMASTRSAHTLRPGEMVMAMGNPWDNVGALSTGIVHRASRSSPWLISDIRLAPGNSGGPLADAHGNVVGVNSMIVAGFGWSVTSDTVREFLKNMGLEETG